MAESHEQCREDARSAVRRWVTYFAAIYVFGGPVMLLALLFSGAVDQDTMQMGLTVYGLSSGIAGMVVGWWFTKRDEERQNE